MLGRAWLQPQQCSPWLSVQPAMATVTSWKGHTEVVTARRTEPRDVPDIVALFSPDIEDIFGRIDVPHLL